VTSWLESGFIFLLTPEQDLKVLSPKGVLTPLMLEDLRSKKPDILKELHQRYGDIPYTWINAMQIVLGRSHPKAIKAAVWHALCKRLERLIKDEKDCLLQIITKDWSLQDIFGCHKGAPLVRHEGKGLLMLLVSRELCAVHPP
jgi:hypothetical protein